MDDVPSKFVVQRVQYGEGRKHFYAHSKWEPSFHPTKQDAEATIENCIKREPHTLYLLLKVEALFKASEIEVTFIDADHAVST